MRRRRIRHVVAAMGAVLLCLGSGGFAQTSSARDRQDLPLKIRVRPQTTEWQTDRTGPVRVIIDNVSKDAFEETVLATLILRGVPGEGESTKPEEYWSPLDLRERRTLTVGKSSTLSLDAGKQLVVAFADASRLSWELSRGALWPFRPLRVVVPPGDYELSVRLTREGRPGEVKVSEDEKTPRDAKSQGDAKTDGDVTVTRDSKGSARLRRPGDPKVSGDRTITSPRVRIRITRGADLDDQDRR